jgi:hypothetical protein
MHCSFANTGHADMIVSSYCLQSLHLLSVSVCNIFVAGYFVCNALSCAGIVSLSVPAFRSPLDKHKIVLVAVWQTFSTMHIAPYNFPSPSNSLFLGNFGLGGSDYEFHYYYYYYYYYYYHHHHHHHYFSCHRPILRGNSLEPTVIPTAQASSFTLQYFPYYV